MSVARSAGYLLGALALGLSVAAISQNASASVSKVKSRARVSSTSEANGVAPSEFEGSYVLTRASPGDCLPEMLISVLDQDGNVSIEAGTFSFTRVNGGVINNNGGGVRMVEKTYTTSDKRLISSQNTYDSGGSTTKETITFKLNGDRLSVRSEETFTMTGTPNVEYPVSCEYKRVDCSKTASGCL